MKIFTRKIWTVMFAVSSVMFSNNIQAGSPGDVPGKSFDYIADRFADIQVLRYKVEGFDKLTLKQKKLAYYLTQAGLCGRDIFYDQKNSNNLLVRKTLEAILTTYNGDKKNENWDKFTLYCKRFFFANGMHHHYSSDKMLPEFSQDYFETLIKGTSPQKLPFGKASE